MSRNELTGRLDAVMWWYSRRPTGACAVSGVSAAGARRARRAATRRTPGLVLVGCRFRPRVRDRAPPPDAGVRPRAGAGTDQDPPGAPRGLGTVWFGGPVATVDAAGGAAAQRRRREGVYSDRDLVFANAQGRPLQVSTVHRWVKAAFERPGLPFTASVRLGRGSLREIPYSFGSTERLLGRPRKENETHENPPHHNLTRFARVLLVGATALGAKSLVRTRSPVQFRMWAPSQVSRFNPHHSFSTRPTAACHSTPPPHNCESFLVWSLPLELSGP